MSSPTGVRAPVALHRLALVWTSRRPSPSTRTPRVFYVRRTAIEQAPPHLAAGWREVGRTSYALDGIAVLLEWTGVGPPPFPAELAKPEPRSGAEERLHDPVRPWEGSERPARVGSRARPRRPHLVEPAHARARRAGDVRDDAARARGVRTAAGGAPADRYVRRVLEGGGAAILAPPLFRQLGEELDG